MAEPALNAYRQTLDRLGEDIVAARHPVGSSLPPEPQLCEAFAVSRTVVREVVKSLVAKGLLVTGPKLGTRVLPESQWNWFDPQVVGWQTRAGLTREFLRDLQELRRVVEPAAVRLAAERATADDIAALEAALNGMTQAVEQGGDYVACDLLFHQTLLRASHNRMLVLMSKALGALLRTSFEISTARPASAAESLPMHRAVLDALIERSPEKAERASLRLIDGAAADIDAVLASRRRLPSLNAPARPLPVPPALSASAEPARKRAAKAVRVGSR
ncbi:FadR/GntR family transcriptional regulator [Piscinibacter sakaiensis]|uniref:FadR/GntR family transcriptional regulator n=1 Tax=Piscinibacter sakaiensis TaxID=1547922 RepID=UPI003AB07684